MPTKNHLLLFTYTRINPLAPAITDIQYILKEVYRWRDQNGALYALGKLAEQDYR